MPKQGYTRTEASHRRAKFMMLAGMSDFFGTIASFFVILGCIVLLTTLYTWLRGDLPKVVESLREPILNAFQ